MTKMLDPKKQRCRHLNFEASVHVGRIIKEEGDEHAHAYRADVHIHCTDCGEPFVFMGMPGGQRGHSGRRSAVGSEGVAGYLLASTIHI